MTDESKKEPYVSPKHFLLETPLYETLHGMNAVQISNFVNGDYKLDGYCPYCNQGTTFEKSGSLVHGIISMTDYQKMNRFIEPRLICARNDDHRLYFFVLLDNGAVQKVGQHPSFADIAIDETKSYTKLLSKGDVAEFHKAIGLAAHGVGIGSFVYLRRIFERLIYTRFAEYKASEGWDEAAFKTMRMKEKIELLRNHLPEFLVANAKLYSILSVGLHELKEEDCLAFFPVLKQSSIWILEQDKKKKNELEQRRKLEQAIATFQPPKEIAVERLGNSDPKKSPELP